MKITVIGAGYVGLVTGGCLAEIGHEVVCTDSDVAKLGTLESGHLPIYEPGLEPVIARARKAGRAEFPRESRRSRRISATPSSSAWAPLRCRMGTPT